ncbi:efflux RND transporter periplasmic adaptor subunit [Pseudomonas sp. GV071]|uniref:efflux RND transporter periplasmic adaptor subunit n=1 Tax=Pseudomonas sp. GV071 TaxID=2135754 RepID=UPI000D39469A|nr:efflux RND transporter periplasmic adaptor subunit [Pseudomonas sp. GV071]PTQ72490.1 membrane fusion protein (multidrug efflux system) [Pseudomonas sp. GV071]
MLLRRMLVMLGLFALVVAALAGLKIQSVSAQIAQFSAPKPAISVSAANSEQVQWQNRLPAIGTLKALQGIDLTVESSGTVQDVLFRSGEKVSLHQPLIQLDSDVESATLATSQAERDLAQVEFDRARSLLTRQALSKSEYDRLAAELLKANTRVAQLKAIMAKKRILAPFAGTIGIRQIDVGDFVSSGTIIATLQDVSSLYVDFYLPEQSVPQLKLGQRVRFSVAAFPKESFEGEINAINPKVENSTRNVQVRAILSNPESKLLPGMFANLEVLLPSEDARVVVPETALTYTLYGNSVYVIGNKKDDQGVEEKDDKGQPVLVVERRFVETGERRDGKVIVLKGLKAGEQVVTAGQLKLDNGSHVAVVTDDALMNSPAAN